MAATTSHKEYFDFVKSIGESKSKQEEDRIILDELVHLKKAIHLPGIAKKKLKELVVRLMYVEMLGQDASFGYIKAVELCAATSITQKKVGYLAAALFLSPEHEFRFMLVNQIQRDMKSSNILEIGTALTATCKLVTEDMIPAVIGDVLNLLKHDMESVRKKAVGVLHRFYQMDKRSVLDHVDKIRRALCDKDPSVMGATLPLFQAMIIDDPMLFKDLVPSFVSILKQIIEHRLPRDFDYHRIPSPWIQMDILRILALLGRGDQSSSEGMYEVLIDAMKRSDTGINVGYAIVYECIKTVTMIYPNTLLMDAAASSISRFIRSESHNLKYIGIKGLASIVKDHPSYAADHQMAVIDCLEDPDETLKRKTLDLLFRMTNSINVEFIVDKLLSFLSSSADDHFRSDLVNQITQCAERYAPSNTWYVQTIIKVFELAGDKVKQSVAQTLIQLIAEGAEMEEEDDEDEDENKDDELRAEAVEHFLILLENPKLPAILAQTMTWVLGEYGYLSKVCTKEMIMDKLCHVMSISNEPETKCHIITALSKLIAQAGTCPNRVYTTLSLYTQSRSLELQQRCLEVIALLKYSSTGLMADVLPVDASCEDIEIDENLYFLQDYVNHALQSGARPYELPTDFLNDMDNDNDKKTFLKITPYELPKIPVAAPAGIIGSTGSNNAQGMMMPTPANTIINNNSMINNPASQPLGSGAPTIGNQQLLGSRGTGTAQVWGKKPEPPPPAPIQTPSVPSSSGAMPQVNVPQSGTSGAWGNNGPQQAPVTIAAAPVAVVPVVETPKVLTEKEKMAAALFGGMGGNKTSSGVGANKQRRASTVPLTPQVQQPVVQQQQQTQPSLSSDLFGGMSVTTPVVAPAPAPVVSSFMMPEPVIPAATTSANVNNGSASMELLDMVDLTPLPPSNHNNHNHFHSPMPPQQHLSNMHTLSPLSPATLTTTPSSITSAPSATTTNLISDVFGNIDLSDGQGASLLNMPKDDGVRPLVINTNEFGRRWGSCPIDHKQSISCSHLTRFDLDIIKHIMPANYHHVESIPATLECIFAATATTIGAVILVHVKLQPLRKSCDVLVKSSTAEICGREANHIAQTFSTFRG